MKTKEEQIDEIVVSQADDDKAWGDPILVRSNISTTLSLTSELATRAAFFARLHKVSSAEEWIKSIIKERVDFEEAAFVGLKQVLSEKKV